MRWLDENGDWEGCKGRTRIGVERDAGVGREWGLGGMQG